MRFAGFDVLVCMLARALDMHGLSHDGVHLVLGALKERRGDVDLDLEVVDLIPARERALARLRVVSA